MRFNARHLPALPLLTAALVACTGQPAADLLLRGGVVVDGTGSPARRADVAIAGGRVSSIGEPVRAARTIDVDGLVVAPGFVDMHGHADLIALADPAVQERSFAAKIRQGVTTLIVGNCGLGVAPANEAAAEILQAVNGWMTPEGVSPGPMGVGAFLDRLETQGVALNVGTLAPHGPVRISVMGLASGRPSPEQLGEMRRAVGVALDEGAFGVSMGLIYPPGMYSATDELIALAEEAAARDRLVTLHVRGSSETLLQATRELIEIARATGARVHHSHLEAVGEPFWPLVARVLELEDEARAEGLRVSHDVFPYTRAATMMSAIFPPWALEGGVGALLDRLRDPAVRERLRHEIETRRPEWPPWQPGGWPHNLVEAVGWDGILVASVGPGGPSGWIGRSLEEIARDVGRHPFDVVADLMVDQEGRVGQLVDEISGRGHPGDTLLSILAHPAAAVVSDAEDYGRGAPHPAHAGAFVRALRLGREHGRPGLEEIVRRMSSYPASLVGLGERGVLRVGAPADVVVFDPATVGDLATWEQPRRPARGIRLVLINGQVVVDGPRYLGGMAGTVLRAGDR